MSEPHERHNQVTQLLMRGLKEAGVMQDGVPGVMIVIETLMTSIMNINVDRFGLTPERSAEIMDLAYQRALEEFIKQRKPR